MKIGIINNHLGNIASVYSALKFYNLDVRLVNKPTELKNIDVIILAGVGNFNAAAKTLKDMRFWKAIDKAVRIDKKPVVGLCLGMQMFADVSTENGENPGFGWISGKVVRLKDTQGRVPHIGWDQVLPKDKKVFQNSRYNTFYFMHSYHFVPDDKKVIIGSTPFGDTEIVSAVRKNHMIGVQFHPEKSQGDGLRLLRNLVEAVA